MVVLLHSTYRLLLMMMLTIWARAETEDLTCAQKEGTCVPEDDNSCSHEADYPGCDEDEMCCISFPGSLRQKPTDDPCGNKKCQETSFKGICKLVCPKNRIPTGSCNEECQCCGCKIKNNCKKKHGYCIKKGIDTCDGKTKDSWCKGKKCTCCIPRCPQNKACLGADGRCDDICNHDEEPSKDIECINKNCFCCIPKKETCVNSTCCQAAGGYCNTTCPVDAKEDKTLCEGIDCTCCLPPVYECPCHNNDDCKSARGHCDHRCQADERANTSLPCEGKSCVCCVPDYPCRGNDKCHSVNGRCDERCNDHEVVDTNIPCSGDSCVCCVPRSSCSMCCPFEDQLYGSGCIRYEDCNSTCCVDGQWLSCNTTSCIVCPDPFTKVGEECFYRSDESVSMNWDDSRTYCIGLGGDLATPKNVPLLRAYLETIGFGGSVAVWIGADDRDLPTYWRYLNGQQINPCDWSTSHGVNQPDINSEHCLEIRSYFTPPLNNYLCYQAQGFVCQYGASGCPTCTE